MKWIISDGKRIDETDEFKSFVNEVDELIEFLSCFADIPWVYGKSITYISSDNIYSLEPDLIRSSSKTLKSIKACCAIGSFSDANTLTRKFRDDLLMYLFILTVINRRNPFEEEDLAKLNTDGPEEFANSFLNLRFNAKLNDDEKAVEAWFRNEVEELTRQQKKKLDFSNYMNVLKKEPNVEKLIIDFDLQSTWSSLSRNLNNYVHGNGKIYSQRNEVYSSNKELGLYLSEIRDAVNYITAFFVTMLIIVDSKLIASIDYLDHLEENQSPPLDSQYWVAPFIQEFIDDKIVKLHHDLKQFLIDNNGYGMKIV